VDKIISKTGQLLYLNSCTRSLWHCKVSTETVQIFHLVINLHQLVTAICFPVVFLWPEKALFLFICTKEKLKFWYFL